MKKLSRVSCYFFLLMSLCSLVGAQDFYWVDDSPKERTEVGIFIREVNLTKVPSSSTLSIFADTRYLLRVNGIAIGSGPSRFFPEMLFYDTYNLSDYLKKGKNTIAIKVLSHGANTFQTPKSYARIWTQGSIKENEFSWHSLDMGTEWFSREYKAHAKETHKINFALGPIELHDYTQDSYDWYQKASHVWHEPVKLAEDSTIKSFRPREIPFLEQNEVLPLGIRALRRFKTEYEIHSFHLLEHDVTRTETSKKNAAAAYIKINSTLDQEVPLWLWWGDYYLNGEKISKEKVHPELEQAHIYKVHLKKGENILLAKGQLRWSYWDLYLAFPADESISLDRMTPCLAKVFQPAEQGSFDKLDKINAPFGFKKLPNRQGKLNPVWNVAWQPLKEPFEQKVHFPVEVPTNSGLTIDFGKKVLGRVVVTYEAPKGTSLELSFTEDLKNEQPYTLKRNMMFIGTGCIAGGGHEEFETLHPYGFRYVQLNVRGTHARKVKLLSVKIVNETYPYNFNGEFECSDEALNRIWELGPNTLTACSEDAYLDTPYRERGTYAGDALPTYGISLALSQDSRLLKNTLTYLRGSFAHRFHPHTPPRADGIYGNPDDFPLLFVQCLHWYYLRTGDLAYLKECYPEVKYMLTQWLNHKTQAGTFTTPTRAFIEWVKIDKFGGQHTVLNAFLAEAFKISSEWATILGEEKVSSRFSAEYENLIKSIQNEFWDHSKGCFIDGTKESKKRDTAHPMATAVCILYDIATEEQKARGLDYIEEELKEIGTISRQQKTSPYGSFYILNALYGNGKAASAERFIKKHWYPMVADEVGTAWENFDNVGIGTLSHVWSAHPTYFLSSQVLGVPLEFLNGRKKLSQELIFSPQTSSLTWAKGTVPHPAAGLIQVHWYVKGQKLYYNYTTENEVAVQVRPLGSLKHLDFLVNGVEYE